MLKYSEPLKVNPGILLTLEDEINVGSKPTGAVKSLPFPDLSDQEETEAPLDNEISSASSHKAKVVALPTPPGPVWAKK